VSPVPPPPAPAEAPEVQVIAPHRDVGETTVRREDAGEVAGTFGDPTRVAEALPGFVPTASGLQAFFVRGAPPMATGYFIDGVPVPLLYHIGFGPSVIHPGLVDHVDFYQGAPSAQYGRYVGGVIAASTTPPASGAHGEANLRLFDAGALAEAPVGDGRGSVLAAARYGYPGLVLPLFTSDTGLAYWDYQARATWKVDDRDRIGAFVFGSYDRLTQVQRPGNAPAYTQQLALDEFHRADVRWDRALGRASTLRVAATLGHDRVGNDTANADDTSVRLRTELDTRASDALRVRAGADVQLDALRQGSTPEGAPGGALALVPSRDAVVMGGYADVAWRVSPRVEITPGLRADVYSTENVPALPAATNGTTTPVIEPRLAARVRVASWLTSVSAFGVSHQLLGIPPQYPETTPYIQPGVQQGLMTSVQASQGIEVPLPASFSLGVTGFLHDYFGLPDVTAQCNPIAGTNECITPQVNGRAVGMEVLLRRSFAERFTLWISYTLSQSTRQARLPGEPDPTVTILSEYDRTHVGSVVASYDFGRGWKAGTRLFAYSGRPYTPSYHGGPALPYDTARLPAFWRIDARIEKTWMLRGGRDRITVVLEGINVTLNQEAIDAHCEVSQVGSSACVDTLGPITIPSIGIEGSFR
jgi:hypothetical protein